MQDLRAGIVADPRFRKRLAGPLAAEFGSVGIAHDAVPLSVYQAGNDDPMRSISEGTIAAAIVSEEGLAPEHSISCCSHHAWSVMFRTFFDSTAQLNFSLLF